MRFPRKSKSRSPTSSGVWGSDATDSQNFSRWFGRPPSPREELSDAETVDENEKVRVRVGLSLMDLLRKICWIFFRNPRRLKAGGPQKWWGLEKVHFIKIWPIFGMPDFCCVFFLGAASCWKSTVVVGCSWDISQSQLCFCLDFLLINSNFIIQRFHHPNIISFPKGRGSVIVGSWPRHITMPGSSGRLASNRSDARVGWIVHCWYP